jgi:hypothetical protein
MAGGAIDHASDDESGVVDGCGRWRLASTLRRAATSDLNLFDLSRLAGVDGG